MVHHHRLPRTSQRYRTTQVASVPFTQEELDVLALLTWHVGGDPSGPRGVVDRLAERLRELATPRERRDGKTIEVQGGVFLRVAP